MEFKYTYCPCCGAKGFYTISGAFITSKDLTENHTQMEGHDIIKCFQNKIKELEEELTVTKERLRVDNRNPVEESSPREKCDDYYEFLMDCIKRLSERVDKNSVKCIELQYKLDKCVACHRGE